MRVGPVHAPALRSQLPYGPFRHHRACSRPIPASFPRQLAVGPTLRLLACKSALECLPVAENPRPTHQIALSLSRTAPHTRSLAATRTYARTDFPGPKQPAGPGRHCPNLGGPLFFHLLSSRDAIITHLFSSPFVNSRPTEGEHSRWPLSRTPRPPRSPVAPSRPPDCQYSPATEHELVSVHVVMFGN